MAKSPMPKHGRRFRPVVTPEHIQEAVAELGEQIVEVSPGPELLVVVAVLKGAVIFLADLVRHLAIPLEVEFVRARSYRGAQQEEVEVMGDLSALGLEGRAVLLLDCVLDTGRTLSAVQRRVNECGPADLRTCVLFSKRKERSTPVQPDFVGLEIPDVFVVGYGLDHGNRWRHLPYLGAYEE